MKNSIQIQNDKVIAQINLSGAELSRLYSKQFDREILWDGNPDYWGRHAPVLFPFVGKLKDGKYKYNGKEYFSGQHGFARDQEFTVVEHTNTQVVLELNATDKTKELYPFNFRLITTFTLSGSSIKTNYTVENKDDGKMYFSLGAHPAFNCPMSGNDLEDYKLTFDQKETSQTLLLSDSGLLSNNKDNFLVAQDEIQLNDEIFEKDALMFTDLKSKSLTINSDKDDAVVRVSWHNFPYLGIWKPIGAPFLCIEPWYGIADFQDTTGLISEKFGIVKLDQNKKFEASYNIEISQ